MIESGWKSILYIVPYAIRDTVFLGKKFRQTLDEWTPEGLILSEEKKLMCDQKVTSQITDWLLRTVVISDGSLETMVISDWLFWLVVFSDLLFRTVMISDWSLGTMLVSD